MVAVVLPVSVISSSGMDGVDGTLLKSFAIEGSLTRVSALKRGHINDTYISVWSKGPRYIHQRINHRIFRDVPGLMGNIAAILERWRQRAGRDRSGQGLRPLELVPTREGGSFLQTTGGEFWRTYRFVEGTRAVDFCRSASEAREAARAFSKFQEYLVDFEVQGLIEVIPGFHDTSARLQQLQQAARQNPCGRLQRSEALVEKLLARRERAGVVVAGLAAGDIPLRVTHNDLKVNNVLFDEEGTQAVTVVDLDTCMPGSLLYDFGDLMRCTAVPCAEDERDLTKVVVDTAMTAAVFRGYLEHLQGVITPIELDLMPKAPALLALELSARFLTDYLLGDRYFKVNYPEHNYDRALTQATITERFEALEGELRRQTRGWTNV